MSPDDLFAETQRLGITLSARGDRLHVEAPAGRVTPELRAALARHKPALLARLAPVTEFVSLRGGLVVPLPALLFALDLEARGFRVTLDMIEQICIEPSGALTDEDRSAIARWRLHLGALVGYQAPDPEWLQ
jgi:hypothetical protein